MNKIKLGLAAILVGMLIVGCGGHNDGNDQAIALTNLKQTQAAIAALGSGKFNLTFTKTPAGLNLKGSVSGGENRVRLRDGSINVTNGAVSVKLNAYEDTTTVTGAELAAFKGLSDILATLATKNPTLRMEGTFTYTAPTAIATITNYSLDGAANSFSTLSAQDQASLTNGASMFITDFLITN